VESFGELVERFEGPLYAFLRLRTAAPEDAEELAQDTFLRAWEKLDRFDPRYRFSTWLFTLAKRLAATRYRRRRPGLASEETLAGLGHERDPATVLAESDERENLWRVAERALPPEQVDALWMRYAEDFSAAEIGAVLGRPEATVRVHLFRARQALARHLEDPAVDRPSSAPADPDPSSHSLRHISGGQA
jgi:RNA polymerase sigma-70 factor (ECF subfamily)